MDQYDGTAIFRPSEADFLFVERQRNGAKRWRDHDSDRHSFWTLAGLLPPRWQRGIKPPDAYPPLALFSLHLPEARLLGMPRPKTSGITIGPRM